MNDLFQAIKEILPTLPGWCTYEKAKRMSELIIKTRPNVSVEIGVFGGSSFIPIAMTHAAIYQGRAWAIDPWDTQIAVNDYEAKEHRQWWEKVDMNHIYENFNKRIAEMGLRPYTNILRKKSNEVMPPAEIGFLHIDGGHSDIAINDAARFAPRVLKGGYVVVDDLDGVHGQGPIRAADELINMGFKKIEDYKSWGVFVR